MTDWPEGFHADKFEELHERLRQHALQRRTPMRSAVRRMLSVQKHGVGAVMATLDDIERGITASKSLLEQRHPAADDEEVEEATPNTPPTAGADTPAPPLVGGATTTSPYIKITLRLTGEMLLYEQRSMTAPCNSDEGRSVAADNERYARLLAGVDGVRRRTCDGEAQTINVLCKSRLVNTETIHSATAGAYVSNFEMYDTYKDMLEQSTQSLEVGDGQERLEVTTYKVRGIDEFAALSTTAAFESALIMTLRILAGNVFEPQQRRFRNMITPDPLAPEVRYRYRLSELWRYQTPPAALRLAPAHARAVADLSWCPRNGDICAVAYGMYVQPLDGGIVPDFGCVCVWSIKNPVNPERCYHFEQPAVSVEFSPFVPQLLAIGLYDGSVEVRDIGVAGAATAASLVAATQRPRGGAETDNDSDEEDLKWTRPPAPSINYAPVVAIKWLPLSSSSGQVCGSGVEPLLVCSRESAVIVYRLITGPHLLACPLVQLDRVDGILEGLSVERPYRPVEANRYPQALGLCPDPVDRSLFFVLTDEGCQHRCSTNHPGQHLDVLQVAQDAACNGMQFSPWSPRLYLTYGNDWCVRIWMTNILRPLITLQHGIGPVQSASWCPTHSTILVSNCGRSINVWDIRRSILRPMSTTSESETPYTLFKFSNCGRSLAIGNQAGEVIMLALEDMPFPPHYQYDVLAAAIRKAIANDEKLTSWVRGFGYFGYPERRQQRTRTPRAKSKSRQTE